jgi:predicted DNA-binding protein (MmcQ/YjbR family)
MRGPGWNKPNGATAWIEVRISRPVNVAVGRNQPDCPGAVRPYDSPRVRPRGADGPLQRMRFDRLQSFARALPHTTVVVQWGGCHVFKVAGKMFLILVPEGGTLEGVIFKCTPDEFDDLTEHDGIIQAPYCAKRHWVKVVDLVALTEAELQARIRRSRELVIAGLARKTRQALGLGA